MTRLSSLPASRLPALRPRLLTRDSPSLLMLKLLHLLSLLKRLKRKQKSFLNSAMKSDLGSELFEERIKLKKEADQELALQMLRRRMRKMQDSGVPSVFVEGRTRKRSIQESKDSFEEIERQERV